MQRYRLIQPDWSDPKKPEFVEKIDGPRIVEGYYSLQELEEKNASGYNIYYFPNYSSEKVKGFLRGKDVDVFKYCFVDMDLKDGVYQNKEDFIEKLVQFGCPPNSIVNSGNGIHAYWRIKDLDRDSYLRIQKKLIQFFDTDKSIWTVLQLMRAPGFYNTKKHGNYKLAEENILDEKSISCVDLERFLPDLSEDDKKDIKTHISRMEGLSDDVNLTDVNLDDLPEAFEKLLEEDELVRELFYFSEKGKRSEADMKLANILFSKHFNIKEAVQVISQTEKARSKGPSRIEYATTTVSKVYERAKHTVMSVAERKKFKEVKLPGILVKGPEYFDCLHYGWRTKQVCGLIGPTGCGKSTACMDMFRAMMTNDPNEDHIYVYFNLEMPEDEIIQKWDRLTDGDEKLARRFFVVSNEDENGDPRNLNVQKIFWYIRDLQKSTGCKVIAIAIDHIGCINPQIDVRKKPNFGLEGETEGAYKDFRTVTARKMPEILKSMAKQLDIFVIVQSQTTKEKAGEGDIPLGMGAAYGATQFEHYMDYILTIWQPIKRVQYKTRLGVMGWKYCKIRNKHSQDGVTVDKPEVLHVDIDTGKLRELDDEEFEAFQALKEEADIARKQQEKKSGITYTRSRSLQNLTKALSKMASND